MSQQKRFIILLTAIIPFFLTIWSLYESFKIPPQLRSQDHSQICTRDPATTYFQGQFSNPAGVLSVLLLVGGDTVQKAVAQMTRGRDDDFTPVVFSFGWVSYAVSLVATAFGDAMFLPGPEHPGYVVNVGNANEEGDYKLASGDRRDNRSWRLGRLIRDLELSVKDKAKKCDSGLYVTVYRLNPEGTGRLHPKKDMLWWTFLFAIPTQLGIACVPLVTYGDWSIFVITLTGNVLAILTASLPLMRKLQYRQKSQQSYALTRGNGHRHVFIIRPDKYGFDLHGTPGNEGKKLRSKLPYLDEIAVNRTKHTGKTARGLTIVYAALWIMLLVAVGGLKSGTWYLLGVGVLGMSLNIVISSARRDPDAHGLPLKHLDDFGFEPMKVEIETEEGQKREEEQRMRAKDVLLELEAAYPGAGHALKPLFFTNVLPNKRDKDWEDERYSLDTAQERLKKKPSKTVPDSQKQVAVVNQGQAGAVQQGQANAANQAQPETVGHTELRSANQQQADVANQGQLGPANQAQPVTVDQTQPITADQEHPESIPLEHLRQSH